MNLLIPLTIKIILIKTAKKGFKINFQFQNTQTKVFLQVLQWTVTEKESGSQFNSKIEAMKKPKEVLKLGQITLKPKLKMIQLEVTLFI